MSAGAQIAWGSGHQPLGMRRNRTRSPGRTGQDVGVVIDDDGQHRVPAGRGVVGEEHQRLPRVRHLDGTADDRLAGQLASQVSPWWSLARSSRGPASRTPTRSASAVTAHGRVRSASTATGKNQSSRGPRTTRRTTSVTGGPSAAATSTSAASCPATAVATASRRPGASGAGPTPMVGVGAGAAQHEGLGQPTADCEVRAQAGGGRTRSERSCPSRRSSGVPKWVLLLPSTATGVGAPATQTRDLRPSALAREAAEEDLNGRRALAVPEQPVGQAQGAAGPPRHSPVTPIAA